MFDEMAKQIDVVFVATPDHTHACASMMAIKHGKHVYCEKPLTHDIYEARALGEAAREHKVMTQMGNQGHAGRGHPRCCASTWKPAPSAPCRRFTPGRTRSTGRASARPDSPVPPSGCTGTSGSARRPMIPYRDGLHPSAAVVDGWYQWMNYGTGLLLCVGAHVSIRPTGPCN